MQETVIKVENVVKRFGRLKALNDLSFAVPAGICFGLLGPNGAGKTTMMKILYGTATRDSHGIDTVSVFGFDPHKDALRIKFLTGIVPQEDNLDQELSVEQNLGIYARFYGLSSRQAAPFIESVLAFMELADRRKARIKELSGGMKRRLLIARALINNPRLLILDEPTTGLDPQVRHLIWDKLRTLKKNGVTILLTTHYMEEAFQICDDLIIMNRGARILQGAPGDLIRDHIERYVLEILDTEHEAANGRFPDSIRTEASHNRKLLYTDDFTEIKRISDHFAAGDFILRQSNLEDVFLRITGSHLHE